MKKKIIFAFFFVFLLFGIYFVFSASVGDFISNFSTSLQTQRPYSVDGCRENLYVVGRDNIDRVTIYRYSALNGSNQGSLFTNFNPNFTGITVNCTSSGVANLWLLDTITSTTERVTNFFINGTEINNFSLSAAGNDDTINAITNNGTYIFVYDAGNFWAFAYLPNGTDIPNLRTENFNPSDNITGITSNGTHIWYLVNQSFVKERIIASNSDIRTWNIESSNSDPRGMGNNGTDFWVTNYTGKSIYRYFLYSKPILNNITLQNPTNNQIFSSQSVTFATLPIDGDNSTDLSVSLFGNWSGSWHLNTTNSSAFNNSQTNFTLTIPDGIHIYGASVSDGSETNFSASNFTFIVDTTNPSISYTANTPSDSTNLSQSFLLIEVSTSDANFQNITYILYNKTSIINSTTYTTLIEKINFTNLNDTDYRFNVTYFDKVSNSNTTSTRTITLNTKAPNITITSLSTTQGSQTFDFNTSINDTFQSSITCKYSIFDSNGLIDGTNENISFTCNNLTSATASDFGSFTLTTYANDIAGNENSTNKNFTLKAFSGTPSGGSGAGSSAISLKLAENFSIVTNNRQNLLDIFLAKETSIPKEVNFLIVNDGLETVNIELSCEDSTEDSTLNKSARGIRICDYISFKNKTYEVIPNINQPTTAKVTIETPKNSEYGDEYFFNIVGISNKNEFEKLSAKAEVNFIGQLGRYVNIFGNDLPLFLILSLIGLIILVFSIFISSRFFDLGFMGFGIGIILFILIDLLGVLLI